MDLQKIKKADLHVHLSGCIPSETIVSLVSECDIVLPAGFTKDGFLESLKILSPVQSHKEYFRPWEILKKLPKGRSCLRKMISSAMAFLQKDNVAYVEFRKNPFNIPELNNISLDETLCWLIEDLNDASLKYNVMAKLVISLSRYKFNINDALNLLNSIKRINNDTIVGIDLSGDEELSVPHNTHKIFRKAKDSLGLGVTIHAGETGNLNNVIWAIEECKADRIAHAIAAINDPNTIELIRKRDICIEVCLTSNYLLGKVHNLDEYSIWNFLENNVPFVLCSDNPQINNSSLSDECNKFLDMTGRKDIINKMFERQMYYRFTK